MKKCGNCGYDDRLMSIPNRGLSVCPSCYAVDGNPNTIPEYGWYGAGFSVGKGEHLYPGAIPPTSDKKSWVIFLHGMEHAHADYPDEEAVAGILQGDFTRGEPFESFVLRILKFPLFEQVQEWID